MKPSQNSRKRPKTVKTPTPRDLGSLLLSLLLMSTAHPDTSEATQPTARPERKPNVVLIIADDLGYRELGCYGQKKIQTPRLDRLAQEGLRFTRAYSGSPVCAPSRCVLMTGKHPGHAWIRSNREAKPEGQEPLPAREVTLGEVLQQADWQTGAFGKWGLGPPRSEGGPLRQGFDRFFGYNCQRHAHSYYPSYLWSDDQRIALDNKPPVPGHAGLPEGADPKDPKSYASFQGQDYAPRRIADQALEFVRANKDRPFFLYYPTVIPHVALHVPDEELAPYLALGWKDPPFTRERGGYTPHFTPRAAYAAMITHMDRAIGRLLDLLDELELSRDTLVIFSSDNGTTHLRDEVDYDFFESVGELRGLKGSLYEGGIRVPMIARWPGKIAAGSVSDRVVGFEDILPTLAEITGVDVPAGLDGISFAPTLLGKPQPARQFLYREFAGYGGQQALWIGRFKAIRRDIRKGKLDIELYDLESDPGEQTDLAAEHPEMVTLSSLAMESQHETSELFRLRALDGPPENQKDRR